MQSRLRIIFFTNTACIGGLVPESTGASLFLSPNWIQRLFNKDDFAAVSYTSYMDGT